MKDRRFCYQCEQTGDGTGCRTEGTCGKTREFALIQDRLVGVLQEIGHVLGNKHLPDSQVRNACRFLAEALAATVAVSGCDPKRSSSLLQRALLLRDELGRTCPIPEILRRSHLPAAESDSEELVGLAQRIEHYGEDVAGLQELLLSGLRGTAAFTHQARELGHAASEVDSFLVRALGALAAGEREVWELLALCLECGQASLRAMEILHQGNAEAFGSPRPTRVRITPVVGKAILVSGHDLGCLDRLLRMTANAGIHVYTHGDMLSAHGYPGLARQPHLIGNFGGSWHNQQEEFAKFPGPTLMTSNCLLEPLASYRNRLYTTGLASWPGVSHLGKHDLLPLLQAALECPGFTESGICQAVTVGYGHETMHALLPSLADAIRRNKIRHVFVIGGCDGPTETREYYTHLAAAIPGDCIIFVLGCAKYRFNRMDFGAINGIPRLLDVGQCSDMFSLARILLDLGAAFQCDVNELPVSFVLSWHGQRTVAALLALLDLGVEGIRLGPSLPAFLTPAIRAVLSERFGIQAITAPELDLESMLMHEPDFVP